MTLLPDLGAKVAFLANQAGFLRAGIAPIPPDGHEAPELEHFAAWIDRGYAGEMEYLKRRDEENRLLRSSLRVAFPWANSVIVCAAGYNADVARSIDPAPPGSGWIARYAWTGYQPNRDQPTCGPLESADSVPEEGPGEALPPSDYHTVLLGRLEKLDAALKQELGSFRSRCYVDTGPLVERVYAKYAGLGWIGKNTCMLNQEIGSWFFLGVILTELEVPAEQAPRVAPDRCGSCTRCIDACPTGALVAPYEMDASLCISYLTIEKRGAIPEQLRSPIGRQVFGCDICQDVCPWNRRAPLSGDSEMAVRSELVNPALDWLAELDSESFRTLFRKSPLSRAKLPGLLRNVAIAMGNSGLTRYLPKLQEWSASPEPVLAETAQWAIRQIEGHAANAAIGREGGQHEPRHR